MASQDGVGTPSATIYAKNLNEKIKIPQLIEDLRELFETYGTVVEVIAKKSLKRRGQAFIIFDSVESAAAALEDLQDFEIEEDKPMRLAYARMRSDITVKREDGDEALEQHRRHRMAEKERKQAIEAANKPAKRPAPDPLVERPVKTSKPATTAGGLMADEYLPPNKILLLRDIPDDYGKDALTTIFSRFPGFREVRTVPGRKGFAFVEYENEDGAISAKESTSGMTLGEKSIRVTFQKH